MKIAVMTDSTASITKELQEQYQIHVIPLSVVFGEVAYREEIDISTEEFYEKLKESERLPTTSQPSIGLIVEKLKELSEDYDAIISIHLSSEISGTYQAVCKAGEMTDNIEVYAFDSELSAMPQGFYAIKATELIRKNKTPAEIIENLTEMKTNIKAYFMVDDLTNLQRGGRLSHSQALIGSFLQVKPILHFVDKVIVPFEKIRTRKKAIKRIMGMLEEDAAQGLVSRVVFIHSNTEESAIELRDEFATQYPDIETIISYFSPVIGTHLGEGAIGVSWHK
ncbi:MAG TPA: DegV family protein [Virgibacillus sp.]|nr:DegV family protein [Virgibacillus sp.]